MDGVTSNRLSWLSPEGANLDVEGHKDTIIEGLTITKPDGTVIKMDKYQSVANAAAIEQAGAVEQANIAMAKMVAEIISRVVPVPVP